MCGTDRSLSKTCVLRAWLETETCRSTGSWITRSDCCRGKHPPTQILRDAWICSPHLLTCFHRQTILFILFPSWPLRTVYVTPLSELKDKLTDLSERSPAYHRLLFSKGSWIRWGCVFVLCHCFSVHWGGGWKSVQEKDEKKNPTS